jgi:hypothetical protein
MRLHSVTPKMNRFFAIRYYFTGVGPPRWADA